MNSGDHHEIHLMVGSGQISFTICSDIQKAPIIKLVQTILADPDSPSVPQLESEINHLVYALYPLTREEIEIIEGKKR